MNEVLWKVVWAICPVPDQQNKMMGSGRAGVLKRLLVSWRTWVEEAQVEPAVSQLGTVKLEDSQESCWRASVFGFQQQRGPDGLSLLAGEAATTKSKLPKCLIRKRHYFTPSYFPQHTGGKSWSQGTGVKGSAPETHVLLPLSALRRGSEKGSERANQPPEPQKWWILEVGSKRDVKYMSSDV